MSVFIQRIIKEVFANLSRNVPYAVAAILTTMVSLILVGVALLGKEGVNSFANQWSNGVDFEVWMNANATTTEVNAINSQLKSSPLIKHCDYVNHQESFKLVQNVFSNNKIVAGAFTPETTPTFFKCVLTNPADAKSAYNEFVQMPGVMTPFYPKQALLTLEDVTNILQVVLLALAFLMLIAALVLVVVTIRMAIFARRREVAVMKLVGATNWFIRIPFMLEGLIEGVVGAVFAGVIVFLLRFVINSYVKNTVGNSGPSLLQSSVATAGDAVMVGVLLVVIGAIVGTIGSGVAVRRFLNV
jgi:cell division transport system permease protein